MQEVAVEWQPAALLFVSLFLATLPSPVPWLARVVEYGGVGFAINLLLSLLLLHLL